MMSRTPVDVVLDVLDAVEKRDAARLARLYHPDIEFHWPPAVSYTHLTLPTIYSV